MSPKPNYEDAFSGHTKAIIRVLSNIFLDSALDIRTKHMFGHKAFLLNGRPFLLVGEWARDERRKEGIVCIDDRGVAESTVIVLPLNEDMAQSIRKKHGGLYFAPSGTRLKFWISLTGDWLIEEHKLLPLTSVLLSAYAALPEKTGLAHPGRRV